MTDQEILDLVTAIKPFLDTYPAQRGSSTVYLSLKLHQLIRDLESKIDGTKPADRPTTELTWKPLQPNGEVAETDLFRVIIGPDGMGKFHAVLMPKHFDTLEEARNAAIVRLGLTHAQ